TPLGGSGSKYILNNEILIKIGVRIHASPAQIILAYLLKRGIGVVTSSKNSFHIKENIDVIKLIPHITDEDMQAINSTESNLGPMISGAADAWQHNKILSIYN